MTPYRQRVTRADRRTINVVQRRGHLSDCYGACCCGRTDRGYAPVPIEVYKAEWLQRKLRHVVHMTKGGCLGLDLLCRRCRDRGQRLLIVSGARELDPQMAQAGDVSLDVLQAATNRLIRLDDLSQQTLLNVLSS